MIRQGMERDVVDQEAYERTVTRFKEARILVPTFAELSQPERIPAAVSKALLEVEPDAPHPLNLFRVHWYNGPDRRSQVDVPGHLVLPESLTGVPAKIVVALGERFPMIRAHKVLAAFGCLAPRIVTGQFDPTRHRAIWPSTGNYCRGGVAISRIMESRGVAVLPEGMSAERFAWLDDWVGDPSDIIRTPGTESNVKEIYDECNRLAQDPGNVIFNQFSEFGNHLAHYLCTGRALADVFESMRAEDPALRLRGFVSASGSAGTLGAGDYLKERLRILDGGGGGARVPDAAVERVRRAQHPGHRRQARPTDPQRDGDRRRDGRDRPGHRRPRPAVQHRRRASLPDRSPGGRPGHRGGAALARALLDLQRAGGDQDRPLSASSVPATCW